ncbi:hypothetical protein R3P38DRAFT_2868739 [Favolaschia claudopus]|uniref:Uncharacterized protein n=1 Tax=Favolaschia claudopus TaxID=2862362 RepID=A0AAW0DBS7_9AGAR
MPLTTLATPLFALHLTSVSAVPQYANGPFRLGLAGARNRRADLPNAPQCETTCDPVEDILATMSCPPSQCCTPLFQSSYFNCLKCVGTATNATKADWAVAQADVDGLTIACSVQGFTLPELTLPTQDPNRTLSTASGSRSASFSQITISSLSVPSGAPPTTRSQQTVTELSSSSQPPVQQSTANPPAPTTSQSGAVSHLRVEFVATMGILATSLWFGVYCA